MLEGMKACQRPQQERLLQLCVYLSQNWVTTLLSLHSSGLTAALQQSLTACQVFAHHLCLFVQCYCAASNQLPSLG